MTFEESLKIAEETKNLIIFESLIKTDNIINNRDYENILCSISGGSDSDIMLDLVHKCDRYNRVKYIWFDTGIEYQATKNHISFLENKYNIKIIKERTKSPIPLTCNKCGQPFLSKYVSKQIAILQKINFEFKDIPYEELIKLYPKNNSSIKWWCNKYKSEGKKYSAYDIDYNKHLKEFLIQNPPTFNISDKCCTYAKKSPSKEAIKKYNSDLMLTGIRRSEGGIRSLAYNNCFSYNPDGISYYRPIFYYTEDTKRCYEFLYDIKHSDCYTKYGMTRTGCAGCPFNKKFKDEMQIISKYENQLFKAVNNIFEDSYEYTEKYYEFRELQTRNERLKIK